MENEIWKDILGYEGKYQASNWGRVKSLNYNNTGKEQFLKIRVCNGYCYVSLCKHRKVKALRLNRVVWEAFNGKIPEGYECNHINEIKTDNRLSNLNIMLHKDNINWGTCIERRSGKYRNGKLSKQVLQYDLNGNFIKEWQSVMEIQRQLNYKASNISSYCSGKKKSAYGYIWKYASNCDHIS